MKKINNTSKTVVVNDAYKKVFTIIGNDSLKKNSENLKPPEPYTYSPLRRNKNLYSPLMVVIDEDNQKIKAENVVKEKEIKKIKNENKRINPISGVSDIVNSNPQLIEYDKIISESSSTNFLSSASTSGSLADSFINAKLSSKSRSPSPSPLHFLSLSSDVVVDQGREVFAPDIFSSSLNLKSKQTNIKSTGKENEEEGEEGKEKEKEGISLTVYPLMETILPIRDFQSDLHSLYDSDRLLEKRRKIFGNKDDGRYDFSSSTSGQLSPWLKGMMSSSSSFSSSFPFGDSAGADYSSLFSGMVEHLDGALLSTFSVDSVLLGTLGVNRQASVGPDAGNDPAEDTAAVLDLQKKKPRKYKSIFNDKSKSNHFFSFFFLVLVYSSFKIL
jgi:hypothetical protein